MSSITDLGKDISVYAFGNVAQRAVIFFLLPLYTSILTKSEYGLVETIFVTSQILVFLMDIGMSRSVLRYYSRYQDDPQKLSNLIMTAMMVMLISSFIIISIGILGREFFSELLYGASQYSTILVWTLIASFLNTILFWVYILYRAKRQSSRYVLVSLVQLVALTSLTIYFVRYLKMGILGILYAQCVVYFLLSIVFLPASLNLKLDHIGFSFGLARQLFKFGFPLIFTMAGMLIMNSVDRYFLVQFRGLEDVAIYSLGVRIAAILAMLIVTPFQLAWGPYLYEKEEQDLRELASRVFTYMVFVLALGGMVFLLFSDELILFFSSSDYSDSQDVIPFMLISVALMGIYYWAGGLVTLVEKTWRLGFIILFAGLCNIVLNYVLTPEFGWIGASWANVLARSIAVGLTFVLALHYVRIIFDYKRIISVGIFLVGFCSFYYLTRNIFDGFFGLGLRLVVLTISLFLVIVPLRLVTQQEWKMMRGMVAALIARGQ